MAVVAAAVAAIDPGVERKNVASEPPSSVLTTNKK